MTNSHSTEFPSPWLFGEGIFLCTRGTMQVLRLNPQTRVEAKEKPRTTMTPADRKRETRFFGTLGILFLYIIISCVLGWESATSHSTVDIVPGAIARPEINSSTSQQAGRGLIDAP